MDEGDGRESDISPGGWAQCRVTPSAESRTVPEVQPEAAGTHGLQSHTRQRVQCSSLSSVAQSCLTLCNPWTAARQTSLSINSSWSLLKLMSIESVKPSNCLILSRPLLLLPSIFPSIRSFPMSQLFPSGGQSIGVSASASGLPMNIQVWFPWD